ncbi:MAG: DUF1573 domain-containing protein [Luteibaculum sp.]
MNSALGFAQAAEFSFEDDTHRFGTVTEGEQLYHAYPFTNVGEEPLFITNVKVSCMCTKYKFPMKPVPVGAKDTIHVYFDTKGKAGYQIRDLFITANTKSNPTKIRFKALVKKNKE